MIHYVLYIGEWSSKVIIYKKNFKRLKKMFDIILLFRPGKPLQNSLAPNVALWDKSIQILHKNICDNYFVCLCL